MCNSSFRGISTEKAISSIVLVILDHTQDQKVNFKVEYDLQNICYKLEQVY